LHKFKNDKTNESLTYIITQKVKAYSYYSSLVVFKMKMAITICYQFILNLKLNHVIKLCTVTYSILTGRL